MRAGTAAISAFVSTCCGGRPVTAYIGPPSRAAATLATKLNTPYASAGSIGYRAMARRRLCSTGGGDHEQHHLPVCDAEKRPRAEGLQPAPTSPPTRTGEVATSAAMGSLSQQVRPPSPGKSSGSNSNKRLRITDPTNSESSNILSQTTRTSGRGGDSDNASWSRGITCTTTDVGRAAPFTASTTTQLQMSISSPPSSRSPALGDIGGGGSSATQHQHMRTPSLSRCPSKSTGRIGSWDQVGSRNRSSIQQAPTCGSISGSSRSSSGNQAAIWGPIGRSTRSSSDGRASSWNPTGGGGGSGGGESCPSDRFASALRAQGPSFAHMDPIAQATMQWVKNNVVGMNLCPWAGGALLGGHMRVVVYPEQDASNPRDEEEALHQLLAASAMEAVNLAGLRGPAAANATTLIVARPPLAIDFSDFLTIAEHVDDFITEEGLRGVVQLATFHPDYCFADSAPDDVSNYTNRSPYPVLHLLLEDQVEKAIRQIGDPAKVWQKNVDTMQEKGTEAMRSSVEACIVHTKRGESGERR